MARSLRPGPLAPVGDGAFGKVTPCMSPVPVLGCRALTVVFPLPTTNGALDWEVLGGGWG